MTILSLVRHIPLLALTTLAAHAGVIYRFTGIPGSSTSNGEPHAFELVVPDFLLKIPGGPSQSFPCSQLSVALNCEGPVIFSESGIPNQAYAATLQLDRKSVV